MNEQKYYDIVAEEIQSRSMRSGLWARAVAETNDENTAVERQQREKAEAEAKERQRRSGIEKQANQENLAKFGTALIWIVLVIFLFVWIAVMLGVFV